MRSATGNKAVKMCACVCMCVCPSVSVSAPEKNTFCRDKRFIVRSPAYQYWTRLHTSHSPVSLLPHPLYCHCRRHHRHTHSLCSSPLLWPASSGDRHCTFTPNHRCSLECLHCATQYGSPRHRADHQRKRWHHDGHTLYTEPGNPRACNITRVYSIPMNRKISSKFFCFIAQTNPFLSS